MPLKSAWDFLSGKKTDTKSKKEADNDSSDDDESCVDKHSYFKKFSRYTPEHKQYKDAKLIFESCKWNERDDCIDCICGVQLWTAKRHKKCDIMSHFDTKTHKDKLKVKKSGLSQKKINERTANSTTDMNSSPINYIWLWTTFLAFYFIIIYNLPMYLIKEFNKLLGMFNIKNSGKSIIIFC